MTTAIIVYRGDASAKFDRAYYVQVHLPLVRDVYGPFGLESIDAFFPAEGDSGTIAIAMCQFRNEEAAKAAFASARASELKADVVNFTDVVPARLRLVDF